MAVKEHQRVALTKQLIRSGLLRLLEKRPLEHINVSELCREADVNRATFYRYYRAPKDVLEAMAREIMVEIRQSEPLSQTPEFSMEYTVHVLSYIYAHKDTMKVLIQNIHDVDLALSFSELNACFWREYAQNNLPLDPVEQEMMYTYFSTGGFYMIRRWLLEDMDRTPEQMAHLLIRLLKLQN